MPKAPTYPTPDDTTPTLHLLDILDDNLRNGTAMTRANICFDLLCKRLGHDRDQFPTFLAWKQEDEREERLFARRHADCTETFCIAETPDECPYIKRRGRHRDNA